MVENLSNFIKVLYLKMKYVILYIKLNKYINFYRVIIIFRKVTVIHDVFY